MLSKQHFFFLRGLPLWAVLKQLHRATNDLRFFFSLKIKNAFVKHKHQREMRLNYKVEFNDFVGRFLYLGLLGFFWVCSRCLCFCLWRNEKVKWFQTGINIFPLVRFWCEQKQVWLEHEANPRHNLPSLRNIKNCNCKHILISDTITKHSQLFHKYPYLSLCFCWLSIDPIKPVKQVSVERVFPGGRLIRW